MPRFSAQHLLDEILYPNSFLENQRTIHNVTKKARNENFKEIKRWKIEALEEVFAKERKLTDERAESLAEAVDLNKKQVSIPSFVL